MYKNPYSIRHFWKWYALGFNAGAMNTGAFLACGRFVTHVTGFGTLSGVSGADAHWRELGSVLLIPSFFLLGTMTSATLVDKPLQENKRPHYTAVFGLVTLCLFLVVALGANGHFGVFGEDRYVRFDFRFLALLALASGLQNAAITTRANQSVRTTHLTGITTDLGVGLVRIFSLREPTRRKQEIVASALRIGTIFSFIAGSWIGALCYFRWQYLGFLLPLALSLLHMFLAYRWQRNPENKLV